MTYKEDLINLGILNGLPVDDKLSIKNLEFIFKSNNVELPEKETKVKQKKTPQSVKKPSIKKLLSETPKEGPKKTIQQETIDNINKALEIKTPSYTRKKLPPKRTDKKVPVEVPENEKEPYCGTKMKFDRKTKSFKNYKLQDNERLGTAAECAQKNQIRLWGIKKIDQDKLNNQRRDIRNLGNRIYKERRKLKEVREFTGDIDNETLGLLLGLINESISNVKDYMNEKEELKKYANLKELEALQDAFTDAILQIPRNTENVNTIKDTIKKVEEVNKDIINIISNPTTKDLVPKLKKVEKTIEEIKNNVNSEEENNKITEKWKKVFKRAVNPTLLKRVFEGKELPGDLTKKAYKTRARNRARNRAEEEDLEQYRGMQYVKLKENEKRKLKKEREEIKEYDKKERERYEKMIIDNYVKSGGDPENIIFRLKRMTNKQIENMVNDD
jgi:hypothetical protein